MQLSDVRHQILSNIGKYKSGGTQFNALANRAINLAVDALKSKTVIPGLLKDITEQTLVNGTKNYTMDSDFDIPVRVYVRTSDGEAELIPITSKQVVEKVGTSISTGDPRWYRMFGSVSGVPVLRTYPIPDGTTSGLILGGEFIPILADLSLDPDVNLITKRYFNSVIRIATEMAYRSIVDHSTQPLENIIAVKSLITVEANEIMLRENSASDYDSNMSTEKNLQARRKNRYSK